MKTRALVTNLSRVKNSMLQLEEHNNVRESIAMLHKIGKHEN